MNVLIFENNQNDAQHLQALLRNIDPSIKILATLDSVVKGRNFFTKNEAVDLVLMESDLSDGCPLILLKELNLSIPVILTTMDPFAIAAFQHYQIDFLMKPINKGDLEKCLQKFIKYFRIAQQSKIYQDGLKKTITDSVVTPRLIGQRGRSKYPIREEEVAYFYTQNRIVWVVKKDNTKYIINKTLERLEAILNSQQFFRVNRKMIIRIDTLEKMNILRKSKIQLWLSPSTPFEIIISSEKSAKFKSWLAA